MKKTLLSILIALGLTMTLIAAIITNPSSGTVNVGQDIWVQLSCVDYVNCLMIWGDGTSYSGQDSDFYGGFYRSHSYRNPGTYQMHLRRYPLATFFCMIDEYRTVTVLENRSLTMSTPTPAVGQPITFTAVNFNTPNNIFWDMGDGTTYARRTTVITHTYKKTGIYTVRAFDWDGNTKTTPVTLQLNLTRSISFSPSTPRVDEPVAIQAFGFQSDTIDWNFGDGTPPQTYSTMVSHRFQNPGTFTITAREHNMDIQPISKAITILPENRSLVLSATEVRTDEPVTMTALNFRGPQVLWDFGDGSTVAARPAVAASGRPGAVSGPITVTHAYKLSGNYTVSARDENGASSKIFTAAVKVLGISDQVNLEIAEITLDNGKYYKVVPKNSKAIRAQLRMKMRGTGIVSGFWIVDGQPFHFFNETAYQGQVKTILTPEIPGLPVFDPGMHTITVQLTRPENEQVIFPTLRYFVLPYENEIAVLAPKDGAIIKEDEATVFSWERILGGSYYHIAFSNSLFPLLRNEPAVKWRECPERTRYAPDEEAWAAVRRNQWTYWKVRAVDSIGNIVAESGIQEMKVIVPGAKIGVRKITDMDGRTIPIGSGYTASRAGQLMIHGSLTYPAEAEYLILRVYSGADMVDQLLFRDIRKDEVRRFETSVPNRDRESVVTFQVLKSSSPSVLVGYEELKLKKD